MKRKRILSLLIVFMLVFIWGNSLLSRPASAAISDKIVEILYTIGEKLGFELTYEEAPQEELDVSVHIVRKAAHITEFAVFTALLFLRLETDGKKRVPAAFFTGAAVGAIDETIQIFSHRGSQLRDVLIDSIGAALGLALLWLARERRVRRREQAAEKHD